MGPSRPNVASVPSNKSEREGLLDALIPEPSKPYAPRRTASTAIILLFVSTTLFMAFGGIGGKKDDTLENEMGIGWVNWRGVQWGESQDDSSWKQTGYEDVGGDDPKIDEEEEDLSPTSTWKSGGWAPHARPTGPATSWNSDDKEEGGDEEPIYSISVGTFERKTSEKVMSMWKVGELSKYVWHQDVKEDVWSSEGMERLVVVGDIHGHHHHLSSLLTHITPASSPHNSTVLHLGDLVAKSPLNDSLATVSLARRLGLQGVRGNHDQGVIEWRQWMMAYGRLIERGTEDLAIVEPSVDEEEDEEGSGSRLPNPKSGGGRTGGPSWGAGDDRETRPRKASPGLAPGRDGVRSAMKKRWWWTSSSNEEGGEDGEEPTPSEEEVEEEKEAAVESAAEMEATSTSEGLALWEDPSTEPLPAPLSTTDTEEVTPTPSRVKQKGKHKGKPKTSSFAEPTSTDHPWRPRPVRPTSTASNSASASSSSFWSDKDLSHGVSHDALTDSGALVGSGWEWLELDEVEAKMLGVEIPKGWEWGGEWFQIARHLPRQDYEYMEKLPLTLHVESLRTYLVHAGLLPFADSSAALEAKSKTASSPATLPDLLSSTSFSTFSPPSDEESLLTTPERSLLLVPQNTAPFTMLNMRGLKRKNKAWLPISSKSGRAWHQIWTDFWDQCKKDDDSCESINLLYGHWASDGLQVKDYSIGLDSGCAKGNRLSAFVFTPSGVKKPRQRQASSSSATPAGPTPVPSRIARRRRSREKKWFWGGSNEEEIETKDDEDDITTVTLDGEGEEENVEIVTSAVDDAGGRTAFMGGALAPNKRPKLSGDKITGDNKEEQKEVIAEEVAEEKEMTEESEGEIDDEAVEIEDSSEKDGSFDELVVSFAGLKAKIVSVKCGTGEVDPDED